MPTARVEPRSVEEHLLDEDHGGDHDHPEHAHHPQREQNGHQAQATADAVQAVLHAGPDGATLATIVWDAAPARQLLLQGVSSQMPARTITAPAA